MPRWLPYRHLCMDIFQKTDNNRNRAIVDASSAIILFKAGLFGRLAQTYRLLMTASVLSEVTRSGYPGSEFFQRYGAPAGHHYHVLRRANRDALSARYAFAAP